MWKLYSAVTGTVCRPVTHTPILGGMSVLLVETLCTGLATAKCSACL
jgi:hypothetical protein